MILSTRQHLWQLRLVIVLVITSVTTALTNSARAQIIPDSSLGAESSIITPNATIQGLPTTLIEGGATRGTNLFQSFLKFNVGDGQRVYFTNPAGIENIFTRITGNEASNILGTLGVDGQANLFFLNPNGIIFGSNARLDVAGSFLATTANSFVFENGLKFSATNTEAAPLLTVSLRPGLQFGANSSATINNTGNLQAGQDLTLVAGNLDLQGQLQVGRNLTLESHNDITVKDIISDNSLGVSGDITITAPGDINVGNIKVARNSNNSDFNSISINSTGGSVYLNNSNLNSNNIASGYAGDIAISARQEVKIENSSKISTIGNLGRILIGASEYADFSPQKITITNSQINNSNFSTSNDAGNIIVKSLGDLLITNSTLETLTNSSGKGGNINVEAGSVSLINKSSLFANTLGNGKAGSVTVNATGGTVSLSDSSINTGSNKLAVNIQNLTEQVGGGGGDINITAASLYLTKSSFLNASSLGAGDSGNVSITADKTVSFTENSILNARTYVRGNAGNINIKAQELSFSKESLIQATTFGSGNAGNLNTITQSFSLSDTSRIEAQTFGSGHAGNINIKTQFLSLTEGGKINAETFDSGNGGNIIINPLNDENQATASVTISGSAPSLGISSGLSVNTESEKSDAGAGGNITIKTGTLNISDGGVLSAPSKSRGRGGNISINVNNLNLTSGGQITTNAYRSGEAGSVKINATDNIIIAGQDYQYEQRLNALKNRLDILKAIYDVFLIDNNQGNQQILEPINNLINKLTELLANPNSAELLNELKEKFELFTNSYDFSLIANNPELKSLFEPISNLLDNFNGLQQILIAAQDSTFVQKINELKQQINQLQYAYNFVLPQTDGELKRILGSINQYSGLFANTEANSTGNGGTINIDPQQVTIKDTARISVDSKGTGVAGNISITANRLTLDNQAAITADTNSGQGGSINLNLQDLLLFRRQSVVSTTAGRQGAGGNGGAIAINLDTNHGFIVSPALENNDIAANAFSGSGGTIEINAKGVIGLATLTRPELEQKLGTTDPEKLNPQFLGSNDITAISQTNPQLNGIVSISSPDIDPSKGIVSLPTNASDPSQQIAQSCGGVNKKAGSAFTDIGRGGLPPKPDELLSSDTVWEDIRLRNSTTEQGNTTQATVNPVKPKAVLIMPATGWVFNNKGEVTLISHTPQSSASWLNSSSCAVKSQ
ncbi:MULTISPECIES: two-partner secretion domain-containing protein [unclassified Tolypothrix]|uniref:two-partner secretion domain-containing protein n=1 Tax=unclassified Tolypothrix TaxID=2649714 RepID=UPI0005EAC433|nr:MULTISPECIES: filamentous hemagglutinin N-terminal domain-containing protein [unclassified Tolypothrix]BAY94681.1 filamentous hemagglutinin-like protein [Microchaete diplosiphon NIES-3275]EKE99090.1 protein, filamentous hemagglutinin family [Tolypothrix sp. PCC 7601]MBE9085110.1 filamentous hemagglutinin N-terminal domain-containing protein [Tolypothrix sp. LEGE 11397]UYD28374.1 filamentous hemagglutinin N-terminal domain-containing protein [Tolypothrix sp. PCC 7712]UYD35748.1 filamentous h